MAENINFNALQGQPANRGQSVLVKLSQSDIVNNLPNIQVGNIATIDNSSNIGYVSAIDTFGGSFTIKPQYPYGDLSSTEDSSILDANATITVVSN